MPEPTFIFDDGAGSLFAVIPDAVPRLDHAIAARATEQEVERGIATTDHVREEADRFSAEIVISDTPIRSIEGPPDAFSFDVFGESRPLSLTAPSGPLVQRLASVTGGGGPGGQVQAEGIVLATGQITIPSTVNTFQPDAEVTRTVDNWAILRAAKQGAFLATITTDLHVYRSMLLLSAEITKTAQDAKWIRVEVIFRQLRQSETQLVDAAEPLRPRDVRQSDDGSQGTTEEEPELVSGFSQIRDLVGL